MNQTVLLTSISNVYISFHIYLLLWYVGDRCENCSFGLDIHIDIVFVVSSRRTRWQHSHMVKNIFYFFKKHAGEKKESWAAINKRKLISFK